MKKKLLTIALCSSGLLFTACGGSSDSNNDKVPVITSNVDYNKAETIDLIVPPIIYSMREMDNTLLYTGNIASEIYADVTEGLQTSCESGTVQKNSNGTVTLNNCKNFKIRGEIYPDVKDSTLSGTIKAVETDTKSGSISTEKYDISLTDFTIKREDGGVESYNGQMLQSYTYDEKTEETKAEYTVGKMQLSWADKTDKESYILSDYQLVETSNPTVNTTPATAKGIMQGDVNGQKFSVKFDSQVEYTWATYAPKSANINIEDTANSKNTITIKNSTDGKALISAFANGASVTGYPKTVNWDYFE